MTGDIHPCPPLWLRPWWPWQSLNPALHNWYDARCKFRCTKHFVGFIFKKDCVVWNWLSVLLVLPAVHGSWFYLRKLTESSDTGKFPDISLAHHYTLPQSESWRERAGGRGPGKLGAHCGWGLGRENFLSCKNARFYVFLLRKTILVARNRDWRGARRLNGPTWGLMI